MYYKVALVSEYVGRTTTVHVMTGRHTGARSKSKAKYNIARKGRTSIAHYDLESQRRWVSGKTMWELFYPTLRIVLNWLIKIIITIKK